MKKPILWLALLAAAAGVGTLGWLGKLPSLGYRERIAANIAEKRKPATVAPIGPAVSVVRAQVADFVDLLLVTGSLVAREEVLVAPEIEGLKILELLADDGSTVKKGQVLARLVNETIDTQLAQNEAALVRTDAAIAQARSNITQAEARLTETSNASSRAKTLREAGHMSESVFDQRDAAARTAEAQLAAARDGQRVAEAEKAQIEAQRRELRWRRGKTEVTAPVDGVVARRNAKVGAMASGAAPEPMFRLIAAGEIELEAEVIETRIGGIKVGQPARVQVSGAGFFDGTVRLVSPEVDRATRMARVRVMVGVNPELKVGAFARATIDIARSRGVAVPAAAVHWGEETTIVQVAVAGKVVTRRVETGLTAAGQVEIKRGIAEGDLVIAKAGTFLRDGDLIRPVSADGTRLSEVRP